MTEFNFFAIVPEIFLLVMGCVCLMCDAFLGQRFKTISYYLAQFTLIVVAVLTLTHWSLPAFTAFDGGFIHDKMAVLLKEFIYLSAFVAFIYSKHYVPARKMPNGEYYVLGLFSVLGMMVLVSAGSFLTLFLGMELMALPIYVMVALERDSAKRSEAAMKYFIIGSMATAMLLYGLSLLYGATKSIDLSVVANAIAAFPAEHQLILNFGLVFVMVGIAFKLGAAPFHMWVPDVYEGAPTSTTLFLSAAPKIAALGLAIRLLIDAMPSLVAQWQPLLIIIAIASMVWGNVAAIAQTNLKRMFAYSSVAHMGYALLGLIAASPLGYGSAIFYLISYALMTLVAFGMLCVMSQSGIEIENIQDFKGLNRRHPGLAFLMLLTLFSMAGIPPLVGFMAKVGVLEAIIGAHLTWLAAVALLFAIVGAYYYLRVVKVMYFEEQTAELSALPVSWGMKTTLSFNALAVLGLGLFPGLLFGICHSLF